MSQGRQDVLEQSKMKGIVAGAATVGTVAVGVLIGPVVAAVAAVPTAYLGYRWWKHRAKNGIRF
jgi:hypothetical protein